MCGSTQKHIKNVPANLTINTFGNSGVWFPYAEDEVLEDLNYCSLVLQENQEVDIVAEDDQLILLNCY